MLNQLAMQALVREAQMLASMLVPGLLACSQNEGGKATGPQFAGLALVLQAKGDQLCVNSYKPVSELGMCGLLVKRPPVSAKQPWSRLS
jgi:hypothetical protein